jgi:hypothetical protein
LAKFHPIPDKPIAENTKFYVIASSGTGINNLALSLPRAFRIQRGNFIFQMARNDHIVVLTKT